MIFPLEDGKIVHIYTLYLKNRQKSVGLSSTLNLVFIRKLNGVFSPNQLKIHGVKKLQNTGSGEYKLRFFMAKNLITSASLENITLFNFSRKCLKLLWGSIHDHTKTRFDVS